MWLWKERLSLNVSVTLFNFCWGSYRLIISLKKNVRHVFVSDAYLGPFFNRSILSSPARSIIDGIVGNHESEQAIWSIQKIQ